MNEMNGHNGDPLVSLSQESVCCNLFLQYVIETELHIGLTWKRVYSFANQ